MNDTRSPLLTEVYKQELAQDKAMQHIVEVIREESQKVTSTGVPSYKWIHRMISQLYETYEGQC